MQFWCQMTDLLSCEDPYETQGINMRQARDMNPGRARTNSPKLEMNIVGMYFASVNDA